jgi:hypothetical protein
MSKMKLEINLLGILVFMIALTICIRVIILVWRG